MSLTVHAKNRSQKRGVPPFALELLERYGRETYDHNGAIILHFDKKSRRQIERDLGRVVVSRFSEYLRCYMVMSTTGEVITVGKLYRRVRH